MNTKPILFNADMIRALLDGRKTQTRRIVKPQPDSRYCRIDFEGGELKESSQERGCWHVNRKQSCPYGQPGDLLWVRETMRVIDTGKHDNKVVAIAVRYEADGIESGWIDYPDRLKGAPIGRCLAYGGHREASRLTLKITDVRVERVQDISRNDVREEGIDLRASAGRTPRRLRKFRDHKIAFMELWDSINGKPRKDGTDISWKANPFVWCITFEVIRKNVDDYLAEVAA